MSKQPDRSARSRSLSSLPPWARPLALALAGALLGACAADAAGDEPPVEVREASWQGFAGIPQQGDELGLPSAPVTLVEFADLRCSHCKMFVDLSLPVLVDRYVRPGKLRIVFHNLPILGPPSVQAARMAVAVGLQGHEFEFIDAFFHRPRGLVTDAALGQIAGQIPGVDVAAAMAARTSPTVEADLADARGLALRLSLEGTPPSSWAGRGPTPASSPTARAEKPETLTVPIEDLLAWP